jgi:hypothetical protein
MQQQGVKKKMNELHKMTLLLLANIGAKLWSKHITGLLHLTFLLMDGRSLNRRQTRAVLAKGWRGAVQSALSIIRMPGFGASVLVQLHPSTTLFIIQRCDSLLAVRSTSAPLLVDQLLCFEPLRHCTHPPWLSHNKNGLFVSLRSGHGFQRWRYSYRSVLSPVHSFPPWGWCP